MPRPRAALDTAALARAFAADGLFGTSIEHVAAVTGLAKPTLYARGGDKEELFALAVEAEVERLLDRLTAGADPAPAGGAGSSGVAVAGAAGSAGAGGAGSPGVAVAGAAGSARAAGRGTARSAGAPVQLARALAAHIHEAPEGARLLFVTARHSSSRVAARVERSLARVFAVLGGDEVAAALLGGAVAELHGGPSVEAVARLLPAPEPEGPPAGIWTA